MLRAQEAAPRLPRRSPRPFAAAQAARRGAGLRNAGLRLLVAAAYLAVMARLGSAGAGPWILAVMWVAVPLAPPVTRGWLLDGMPFALFAAAYDALGLARSFVVARGVETLWPHWFDRAVFGVGALGARMSLNEVFARHHWPAVDVVTGFAYLLYIYAVLAFAVFVAGADRTPPGRRRLRALGWTFLGVNLASFATYLVLPVAPPWYVAAHGFGPVDANAVASPAALVRWDALMGVPYFQAFYAQSRDVFGSMPSMHCAYPLLLLLFSLELRRPRLTAALVAFQLVMCFSAVYLQHHYVADVLVGMIYAALGYTIERLLSDRGRA